MKKKIPTDINETTKHYLITPNFNGCRLKGNRSRMNLSDLFLTDQDSRVLSSLLQVIKFHTDQGLMIKRIHFFITNLLHLPSFAQ